VEKSLCKLNATTEVKAVYRHKTNTEEEDKQDDREVLYITVGKLSCQLYHGDLPGEAEEP
jgi:hypothetical protein